MCVCVYVCVGGLGLLGGGWEMGSGDGIGGGQGFTKLAKSVKHDESYFTFSDKFMGRGKFKSCSVMS